MYKLIVISYSWNLQIFWWRIWNKKCFFYIYLKPSIKCGIKGLFSIFRLRQNGISGDLLNILSDILSNRKKRVVLNGQIFSCAIITVGVPQGSILGPLLFFIYINDLSDGLTSIVKLFADDTSLFSVVHDINTSVKELNEDLNKINNWAFQ